jgi:hypothetical protein
MGRTFARAAGLVAKTWLSAGVYLVLTQLLMYGGIFATAAAFTLPARLNNPFALFSGLFIGIIAAYLLANAAAMAGATAGLLKADRGEAASIGDCFSAGVQMCVPVLGLTILWFLGIYLGFILIIVPGCILLSMWCVAVPALIAEDTGVIGAFGRSRALTKGSRGMIFLTLLLTVIAIYIVYAVLAGVWTALMVSLSLEIIASIGLIIGVLALGILTTLGIQALLVAIYGELVDLKGDYVVDVFG